MIERQRKTLGKYGTNCYLLINQASKDAVLIDAPDDADTILAWVDPYTVEQIVLTHGHADHTGALEELRRSLGVPVAIHPDDERDFKLVADNSLVDGDTFTLGEARIEIVHIPGHTQGSIALKVVEREEFKFALVGDAVFPGGPGHTTSPQTLEQSLESLERTVFTWPNDIKLYPGHGASTTVGDEREAFEAFRMNPLPPDLFGDVLWR